MNVRAITLATAMLCFAATAAAQRISREEYILKYKDIAIRHMEYYGIPASIKMAQGILESDCGNSRLAREANNHFGIKCNDWKGGTISHHDDARNECFRKYDDAEQSFADHSTFLDTSPRYDALFSLDPTDYRGWAHGLREAGYATNPSYAQLLIKIIEDNNLHLLDRGVDVADADIRRTTAPPQIDESLPKIELDNFQAATVDRRTGRMVGVNNTVAYVIAREGDSLGRIAGDFGMGVKKLLKFNDLHSQVALSDGDMVYIRKKAKRSENGRLIYLSQEGDTMHTVSQKFGVRLKNLLRLNRMKDDEAINPGTQIKLR